MTRAEAAALSPEVALVAAVLAAVVVTVLEMIAEAWG